MRTTIRIDEELLRALLARQRQTGRREVVRLITVGGNSLRRGINLDDSASRWGALDAAGDRD